MFTGYVCYIGCDFCKAEIRRLWVTNDRFGAFVFLTAEIRHQTVIALNVYLSAQKCQIKIDADPVLRLLESNHDFCDTKKETKPSLQDSLEQIICYVVNIKKSHSGLCTKEIKKKTRSSKEHHGSPYHASVKSMVLPFVIFSHLN